MVVEHDEHRPVRLADHDGVATGAAVVLVADQLGETEQIGVPGDAGVDVGHGEGDVME
jgi:hypothetical protein